MSIKSCVSPDGRFIYGIHKPHFKVTNFRKNDFIKPLGTLEGRPHKNTINFPDGDVAENNADWIYEIPNPFPFRGTTYITKSWAEAKAFDPSKIKLPKPEGVSLIDWLKEEGVSYDEDKLATLPAPVLLTLAMASTDPVELTYLAKISCDFVFDGETPTGLAYKNTERGVRSVIKNHDLFESVVNNPHLPDIYKEVMVLRPGVQGGSEIVGEWDEKESHIFEYLRRNSYIPWGHYAANMANDAIRYKIDKLSLKDMKGLRHLYFQRTIARVASELGIDFQKKRGMVYDDDLEEIRKKILQKIKENPAIKFNGTLWGWNYGFDYAGTGYRLHASHQQIHQQFSMVPNDVETFYSDNEKVETGNISSYGCGDQIYNYICEYRNEFKSSFFSNYIKAIRNNCRMDDRKENQSLVIYEDKNVILFVPKSQTSQWEIQLMPLTNVGNILEADTEVRNSLNEAILIAMQVLTAIGARMISTIEYSKRINAENSDQHLLYAFLPKLPESMGAFSEAQLRWINGHYPEDFAYILREKLRK
ncbi:MAG: hypothetical protein GY714_08830 [Desulfobacterales bacterium]|nr:hypothetical protein [Desulfobacterales bacterium]